MDHNNNIYMIAGGAGIVGSAALYLIYCKTDKTSRQNLNDDTLNETTDFDKMDYIFEKNF